MTTGSINYAPDYKSEERNPLNVIFEQGMERQRVNAERKRLEREVIEAAKAWKQKRDDGDNEKWSVHYVKMCDAIQSLIDFESQIKKR